MNHWTQEAENQSNGNERWKTAMIRLALKCFQIASNYQNFSGGSDPQVLSRCEVPKLLVFLAIFNSFTRLHIWGKNLQDHASCRGTCFTFLRYFPLTLSLPIPIPLLVIYSLLSNVHYIWFIATIGWMVRRTISKYFGKFKKWIHNPQLMPVK